MYNKKDILISLGMKLLAVISSIYGILLTVNSPKIFSYFTILSNIAIDLIMIVFIAADIVLLKTDGKKNLKNNTLYIVKFVFTVSITITFLVFLFILAPTTPGGMIPAYFAGGGFSFCLHFLTPVLAILDFLLYDYEYQSKKMHAFFATVPALTYAFCVCAAGAMGVRWGNMTAPYNFLNFGARSGWFGWDLSQLGPESLGIGVAYMIAILFLIFLGLGSLFLVLLKNRQKKKLLNRHS